MLIVLMHTYVYYSAFERYFCASEVLKRHYLLLFSDTSIHAFTYIL